MKTVGFRGRVATDRRVGDGAVAILEGTTIRSVGQQQAAGIGATPGFHHGYPAPGFLDLRINGSFGIGEVGFETEELGGKGPHARGVLIGTCTKEWVPSSADEDSR